MPPAAAGKLSTDEYPFVATPSSPSGSRSSLPSSADNTPKAGVSVRSVRTTGGWAKKNSGSPEKPEMGKVGGWVGGWAGGRLAGWQAGICAWHVHGMCMASVHGFCLLVAAKLEGSCSLGIDPPPPASHAPSPVACLQGRRLFVFIVGGVAYNEMRCAHRLSTRLGRDIFLGGTSVETPARFMRNVLDLSTASHLALELDGGGGGGGGGFFRFS